MEATDDGEDALRKDDDDEILFSFAFSTMRTQMIHMSGMSLLVARTYFALLSLSLSLTHSLVRLTRLFALPCVTFTRVNCGFMGCYRRLRHLFLCSFVRSSLPTSRQDKQFR